MEMMTMHEVRSYGESKIRLGYFEVCLYPNLVVKQEDGEEYPDFRLTKSRKTMPLLIRGDGHLDFPANLFLRERAKTTKSIASDAYALLMFARWLDGEGKSYRDVFKDPADGVVHQFGEVLKALVKNNAYQNGHLSLSTAKTYARSIARYYKFLNKEAILKWSSSRKPLEFKTTRIPRQKRDDLGENEMLSHITKNTMITVQTSSLMSGFPKDIDIPRHLSLKPITKEDQDILYIYLNSKLDRASGKEKQFYQAETQYLWVELGVKGGLRINEIATLNESAIYQPIPNTKTCSLVLDVKEGVETKNGKTRTTEIPTELMERLFEYKSSAIRTQALKVANEKDSENLDHDQSEQNISKSDDDISYDDPRLFISSYSAGNYSKKTIQKFWSGIRAEIRMEHPNWYYRFHDTRSTFATDFLIRTASKSDLPYSFHKEQLQSLMGHSKRTETEVYVSFLEDKETFRHIASRLNKAAA
ncbi:site-specific integrase [Vibrio vulnificus]